MPEKYFLNTADRAETWLREQKEIQLKFDKIIEPLRSEQFSFASRLRSIKSGFVNAVGIVVLNTARLAIFIYEPLCSYPGILSFGTRFPFY